MLIKFFDHGKGPGDGPVFYAIRSDLEARVSAVPEVLRGDAQRTIDLINSIDRTWRYTSGVISFALSDAPTETQQDQVMDEFERTAFAGLDADQYDILWVRHQHTQGGRVELHFVTPRMELITGKALNIAPPGWKYLYDPLREALNAEHGWADPSDPKRARELQRGKIEAVERVLGRDAIHAYLSARIASGAVYDRKSLVLSLEEAGFLINRQGKNYVTALDPESGDKFRLKGMIYDEGWTREKHLDRALERQDGRGSERDRGINLERAAASRTELSRCIEKRIRHHQKRYSRTKQEHGEEHARDAALAALDRCSVSRGSDCILEYSFSHNFVDEVRTDRVAQASSERTTGIKRSEEGHARSSVHIIEGRRISCSSRRNRNGMDVRSSFVHPSWRVKDESAYSSREGIAALREQIGEWFKGGNNRLAGFLEGLRCERDERFRESLDRSRELARDIASAIEHFGKAIQRGLGKAREATLKYHRAVERVRENHQRLGKDVEKACELIREQETRSRDHGMER
ncbi:MAG: hypothetical protein JSC188_000448 [Candidatus Tokpelaia sp. JSC188]|nr:MAG: hypothetical protein JSC188_000448 [Candidatus Tokpelaia sp. JSC188]